MRHTDYKTDHNYSYEEPNEELQKQQKLIEEVGGVTLPRAYASLAVLVGHDFRRWGVIAIEDTEEIEQDKGFIYGRIRTITLKLIQEG